MRVDKTFLSGLLFDKVAFAQLKKNEAVMAELTLELANAPERLGPRYTRSQIEATFPETRLDDQMKGFRLWSSWIDGSRGRQAQEADSRALR